VKRRLLTPHNTMCGDDPGPRDSQKGKLQRT
jgi:hypothetical protein